MHQTYITSKSYNEIKRDGKTVDKKMMSATYDGKKAVIDRFENNRAYRYELTEDDIEKMTNASLKLSDHTRSKRRRRGRGRRKSKRRRRRSSSKKK